MKSSFKRICSLLLCAVIVIALLPGGVLRAYAAGGTYAVAYDGNGATGGSAPPGSDVYAQGDPVTVSGNTDALTKTGFAFGGWITGNTLYQPGDTFSMGTRDVVLSAAWIPVYTLTYDRKGDDTMVSGAPPTDAGQYPEGATTIVQGSGSLHPLSGYFKCWNTRANGTGTSYYPGSAYPMGAGNATLYAIYTLDPDVPLVTFGVVYNANGADSGSVPANTGQPAPVNVTVADNTGSLLKNGYQFSGWNTKPDGSGTTYRAGETFYADAQRTLYALWTPVRTLTYVSNGGSLPGGSGNTDSFVAGSAIQIRPCMIDPPGADDRFTGWNTQANGSGQTYMPGDVIRPDTDMTLYPLWQTITGRYAVIYDGCYNDGGALPAIAYHLAGESVTVAAQGSLTRSPDRFMGWADGDGLLYRPGENFTMPNHALTLYARWQPVYTLSYNGLGTNLPLPPAGTYAFGETVILPGELGKYAVGDINGMTLEGYFAGWTTNSGGSGTLYAPGMYFPITGNTTLYARLAATAPMQLDEPCRVVYTNDGGYAGYPPVDYKYYQAGDPVTVLDWNYFSESTSVQIAGWQWSGSGPVYKPGDVIPFPAGVTTLTLSPASVRLPIPLPPPKDTSSRADTSVSRLFYETMGAAAGVAPSGGSYKNQYATVAGNPGGLVRANYHWAGWITSDNTIYRAGNSIWFGETGSSLYLFPYWEAGSIPQLINYFEGENPPRTLSYLEAATVTVAPPVREPPNGRYFKGWNTKSDGSGILFMPDDQFTVLTSGVDLYAVYVDTPCQLVSYDPGQSIGGSCLSVGKTYFPGSTVEIIEPGSLVGPPGTVFAGWNTQSDGSGTQYARGTSFTMGNSPVVLYAMWSPVPPEQHTVTYSGRGANSGTPPVENGTYSAGQTVTLATVNTRGTAMSFRKDGHDLTGWYVEGVLYPMGGTFIMPDQNVVVDPAWTPLISSTDASTITVTYNGNGSTGGTAPAPSEHAWGSSFTLPGNTGGLVRTGYRFYGWSDGIAAYRPGDTYPIGIGRVTTIALNAVWQRLYTVTYRADGSGGAVPQDTAQYAQGDAVTLAGNTGNLTRADALFAGWYVNGQIRPSGQSFQMGAGNVTATAVWAAAPLTGGSPPENPVIKIEENSFGSFLNTITFGLFFKKTVTVTLTADFGMSGIKSIEYQKVASQADYNEAGTWTAYTGPFNVAPDQQFILYARYTDNDDNSVVISSDGVVLDNTAPVIALSGYDGSPSSGDVTVTVGVTDNLAGIASVAYTTDEPAPQSGTVALTEGVGSVTLTNSGIYTLTVTAEDKAGNAASKTLDIHITPSKLDQDELSITGIPGTITYGDGTFDLATSGGSGSGAVTYAVAAGGVVSVSGNTVTVVKAGAATVTATKAGDAAYNPITATAAITVDKAAVTITTQPTVSNTVYIGDPLSTAVLTGGAASAPGAFAWTSPSAILTASDTYGATFTPADSENHLTATTLVSVAAVERPLDTLAAPVITTDPDDVSLPLPHFIDVTVTIAPPEDGAAIRYTTDGGEPTEHDTLYTGAFTVSAPGGAGGSVTVKAKAFKNGMTPSGTTGVTIPFAAVGSGDKVLISIMAPAAITGVENGTAKTESALGLPPTVLLVTDGGNDSADVTWDVAGSSYNPASGSAQTFTVDGTVTLPRGVINPSNISLSIGITVTVNAAPTTDEILVSIATPSAITGVENGTAKTASALGLPSTVTLATNGGNVSASVSWDVAGSSYNPSSGSAQTFTVNGIVTLPDGMINPDHIPLTTSISVSVKKESGSGGDSDSGRGSCGGGGTAVIIQPEKRPDQPVIAGFSIPPTADSNGHATVTISQQPVTDAIIKALADAKAQEKTTNGIGISADIDLPNMVKSLVIVLPRSTLNSLIDAEVKQLEINGVIMSLELDLEALKEIQRQSTGDVTISISPATGLSAQAQVLLGNRPAYSVTISYVNKDGKIQAVTSLGNGRAILSVPYTPGKNEAIGYLFGVYVDDEGSASRIPGSAFIVNRGSLILSTNHFSVYGVGYNAPIERYTDIASHWAKESIDYAVGRGLFSGTTKKTFSPNMAMERGMLVTVLGRLAGADVSGYKTSSFSDVAAEKYYLPYVEWAYKNSIVSGIGGGKFAPERAVTREEIVLILQNYAKATGYILPVAREAVIFADTSTIGSVYLTAVTAMQQAGIMVGGSGNRFNPKAGATRAEVAAMLHRYIKLTIEPATAQGWALNDAGQWLCYKDGKPQTGTQTIDGVKYFFSSSGALQTGWVKDGDNWRHYSGNQALVGWWDIGSNDAKKTYYFTKDGLMVSGKWLQIDGKWYYFYSDGALAKSTKVDGYEVDATGVRKTK